LVSGNLRAQENGQGFHIKEISRMSGYVRPSENACWTVGWKSEKEDPMSKCKDCAHDLKPQETIILGAKKFKCSKCNAIFFDPPASMRRVDSRTVIFDREATAADIIGQHLLKPSR
jgi:hypothetical protein